MDNKTDSNNNIGPEEIKRKIDELFEAFSLTSDGNYVYVCNMKNDLSRWSKNAVDYFDLPDIYMYNAGDIWAEHIHPDDRELYRKKIKNIFEGTDHGFNMQYRAKTRDGNYVICTGRGFVLKDSSGVPEYFGGTIKNHGFLSYVDSITGLRSMYGFIEDIDNIVWKKENNTILMIGLSSFTTINDIFGFTFGNKVLTKLGEMLRVEFGQKGCVYKMDGTKFALITHEISIEEIEKIYKRVKKKLSRDFYVDGERVTLALNAGAVVVDSFEIRNETVYSCLKYAYYESKNKRLGELVVFEDKLSDDNRRLVEKLNVIRNSVADDCNGFFLCYQPIVNADNEQLKGMEALIRWKNDAYGVVPPIQFIPVLEQDTVFPELGRWILKQAMEDGKLFLTKYPDFVMNVNLSYAQLEKRSFVSELFELLDETGFPPQNLCLEITERCRLLDLELLKSMFKIIREKGIKIALDDFGTGFASLGVLRELDVDVIKIDREYVKNIEKSKSDQSTVRFISELANAFSAEVCAEGVETEKMRDFLRNYSIKSLQGYYYSKPIPLDEFVKKYNK